MAVAGIGKAGMTTMRRCFLCAAPMLGASERTLDYAHGRRRFPLACGSCGVLLDRDADPAACRDHLARRCEASVFESDARAGYGIDLYTLRSAATRFGLGLRPLDKAGEDDLRHPHGRRAARAELFRLGDADTRKISLGLIGRPGERETVLAALPASSAWTDDVVLLLDGAPSPPEAVPVPGFPLGAVRVASRPLAGDFAAQRNALQALGRHGWMLQRDADESLDPATGRLLPALAALAEASDAVSIGLARRNRVDGMLSDVFPDVQYRLNRRDVRYAGRVHERPVLDGGWPRSMIALHGAIDHHLSAAHVRARSRRYEALDPGRGRPEEEEALLRA